MHRYFPAGIVLAVFLAGGLALFAFLPRAHAPVVDYSSVVPEQRAAHDQKSEVLPYGEVILTVGGGARIEDLSVRVLDVEDSRCPLYVQCIQAGEFRARVQVESSLGTSTQWLKLGEAASTHTGEITFRAVTPLPVAGGALEKSAYKLSFVIEPRTEAHAFPEESQVQPILSNPALQAARPCYVGGCSGQLCTESSDAVSTCEYREEYGCYRTATCERQRDGECGWTLTPELNACRAGSSDLQLN